MKKILKAVVMVGVLMAVAGTSSFVHAHCGRCGTGEGSGKHDHDGHDHGKELCEKCSHEKHCNVENCKDEAHDAECVCPSKEEK